MAERRLQRNRKSGFTEENVLKKRSRSEGPHGRRKMRNSMHETTKTKQIKPATNGRHSMYTGHVSDDDEVTVLHSGSESPDSDITDQRWTKNPLMMRKSRKNERSSSKTDKRRSVHNVDKRDSMEPNPFQSSSSRDLFIFPRKSDSSLAGVQKSKFQRMEENRNKRIDMAVTSDEECSPQLRISRLRQRAMMSTNMGNNASYDGGINIVPMRNDGSVNASQEFINGTDRKRLSQYEDNMRLSKYDENFNVDQMNGNNYKQQSSKQPKLPNVLPEFLPENRQVMNANHRTNNQSELGHVTKNVTNQVQIVPVQRGIPKHETEVTNRQRQSQGRVKLSSESPKLRNFNEVKASQPTQLKKADQKIELVPRSPNSSSDSLDDLIESNIQYLESEIESGKLKRQSGNFTNHSTENVFQRQVIRQPLRPNVQQHTADNDNFRSKIHDPRTYVSNKLMSTVTKVEPRVQKPTMYSQPVASVPQPQTRSERRNVPTSGSATYSPYMQRKQYETSLDISKSDSHLNECDTQFTPSPHSFQAPKGYVPYPVLNKQTGNVIYVQPNANIEEQIQLSENGYVPAVDAGMFSDVEYNIEVSERIKKWEKKLTPCELEEQRKVLNTIKEYESFSDSNSKDAIPDTPVEVRRELWQLVSPTNNTGVGRLSVNLTNSTNSVSDTNFNDQSSAVIFEPKVVSSETNLHRVFRVVNEPKSKGPQFDRAIHDRPIQVETRVSGSSRRKVPSENSGHAQSMSNVTLSESEIGSNMQQSWPPLVIDSDSGIRKSWRMSRYEDEISEIKELVSDNFNDIRKRFDSDMSETDTKRASSPVFVTKVPSTVMPTSTQPSTTSGTSKLTLNIQPVTPTIQRSPVTIRRKLSDQTPPPASPVVMVTQKPVYRNVPVEAKPIITSTAPLSTLPKQTTVIERKPHLISDAKGAPELWSPNMESQQGLVSIERVKARTLQTIPFSEDPVWKDLEGLATFEKSEGGGEAPKEVNFDEIDELLKLATGGVDKMKSKPNTNFEQQMIRLKNLDNAWSPGVSHADHVMSQSYSTSMTQLQLPREKQRALSDSGLGPGDIQPKPSSKYAFTPPTIQPLKLNSQPKKKSSTSALDEVLEDIRASLQKKPLSPKLMKNLDTSEDNSSTNLSLQSPLTKSSKAFVFPRDQKRVVKTPVTDNDKSSAATPGYDNTQSSWKPAHTEVPPQIAAAANVPYIDPEFTQFPYIINGNYHLDPKLLSEKLKSTGLANDSSDELAIKQKKAFTEQALNSILNSSVGNQTNQARSRSQSKPNVHELDKSVDDLRSLAQEVEFKLSQIKSRIVSADEDRLDSILLALRKFAPTTEQTYFSSVKFTPNYESDKAKKSKLEDALGELEKMYESLDLDDKSLMDRASRREETVGYETNTQRRNSAKSSSTASIQLAANTNAKPVGGATSETRILRKSQIEEIERQTQNEFEDITKSFQVLLDEVTKQCRSVARGSSKYSSDSNIGLQSSSVPQYSSQRPPDEIRQEPPRPQFKLESASQRAVQDSYNTAIKELESVAMGNIGQNIGQTTNKPVQSVMYLNLDQTKSANQSKNQISPTRNLDIQLQAPRKPLDKKVKSTFSQPASSSQFVSMATEFNKPLLAASIIRDTSSSDNQDDHHKTSASLKVELNNVARQPSKSAGRFRKRGNIEHRKSMPAITRSVETQTVETQTEPSPTVSEMKEKFEQYRKASLQDMLSDSSPDLKLTRRSARKLSSGRLIDASSSDEENRRGSKLRHSLSAPDLVALLIDFEKKEKQFESKGEKMAAKATPKSGTPKSVKQRHDKARSRSLKVETNIKHMDMTTSMTSDDGLETPTSKPPVYPVWKYPGQAEVNSPSAKKAESKKTPFAVDRDFSKTASDTEQDRTVCSDGLPESVVRRRTRSFGGEAEPEERPQSFHELVATFEQDPKRLEKIRLSGLRKCASEDSMFTDLILQKIYHSESDLATAKTLSGSGSKLTLELKLKN